MRSRLIATVAAASLALTSAVATPAQALTDKERDALKIIAGAVILGTILNKAKKDKGRDEEPVRHRNRVVPSECVYDVRTGKGRRDVVSRSCMEDYGLARRLPAQCAFEIRTNRGMRLVYGPRCLADFGYRIEGARY